MQRLIAGDAAALDLLYAAYATPALRTAYLITRDRAAAEDAVQEAFVQVFRRAASLREPSAFRPWFYQILVNAAKRLARSPIQRSVPLDLAFHDRSDPTRPSPDEIALAAEEVAQVREAIAGLGEAHRVPLILRYYTALTDEEIALALNLPVGTVKSRLHHARRLLHQRVESPQEQPSSRIQPLPAQKG